MSVELALDDIVFVHIDDIESVNRVAHFFADNIDESYISHGEVIDGRATAIGIWSPELADVFAGDAKEAIVNAHSPFSDGLHLAGAFRGDSLVGLALYEYVAGWAGRSAILHDIVVAKPMRHHTIGARMLAWLEQQFEKAGKVRHIFLESGEKNRLAHRFFECHGYRKCSIVMTKQISD